MTRLNRIIDDVGYIFRLLFSKPPKPTVRELQIKLPTRLFFKAGAVAAPKDLHWLVGAAFLIDVETRAPETLVVVNVSKEEPDRYSITLIGQSGTFIYLDEFLELNNLPL